MNKFWIGSSSETGKTDYVEVAPEKAAGKMPALQRRTTKQARKFLSPTRITKLENRNS
jgi:hypothetical protein